MHRATISLAIDLALLQAAETATQKAGITRSALIRQCIREALDRAGALTPAVRTEVQS